MVSASEIRNTVLNEISSASGVPRTRLKDEMELRDDLQISHQNYVTLAQELRAFIKTNHSQQTLLLAEIDTASATVGSTVQLVSKRINA